MRWRNRRRSKNIEDRRGLGNRQSVRRRGPAFRLGGGTIVIVVVVGLLMGQDPIQLLGILTGGQSSSSVSNPRPSKTQDNENAEFVSVVLADTEDTWENLLPSIGHQYRPAHLVLFTDIVDSACGTNTSATGPFYCPPDQKVYIDLGFFEELKRLGAPGDFARAYVIGHEIGHHVQNLLGTSGKVHQARQRASQNKANLLSVLLELQADCYAGVWAHHASKHRNLLEKGDIEEGLNAAASIGDDRLQKHAGRQIRPESFTHGSSQQRVQWLKHGLETGDINECNTFSANTRSASPQGY